MDDGTTKPRTAQQRRVRQQVENILDLCDANWRDELTNPEVNDAVDKIIRAAQGGEMNAASRATILGIAIGIIVITLGIVGAIAHAIGGWFWWIGGGIMIAVVSIVIGIAIMALRGEK